MAKSAVNQLQEQVDAIRREAYAEGYAAAMQLIQKAAATPPSGAMAPVARRGPAAPAAQAAPPASAVAPEAVPKRRGRRPGTRREAPVKAPRSGRTSRPPRGTNAQLVSEFLQSVAPRAVRPAEIRTALQRDKGVEMAFTSIRHALGQLEARQTVEPGAEDKTWRFRV
jgi:hypothetical protein